MPTITIMFFFYVLLLRAPEITHELVLILARLEIAPSIDVLRLDSRMDFAAYCHLDRNP